VDFRRCEICIKQLRLLFKHIGNRAKEVLELIHSDLCGPLQVKFVGGAKYFLTFINDFSRKVNIYILKSKDEILNHFKSFKNLVENQHKKKIKALRIDNGTM